VFCKLTNRHLSVIGFILYILLNGCSGRSSIGLSEPTNLGKSKPLEGVHFAAQLQLFLKFIDVNDNNYLDAEETDTLVVSIANTGRGGTKNLKIVPTVTPYIPQLRLATPKRISDLSPGDSTTVRMSLNADKSVPEQTLTINVKATDDLGNFAERAIILSTRHFRPPDLQIIEVAIDDDDEGLSDGNTNHAIELGETIEFSLILQNKGEGDARDVRIRLISEHEYVNIIGTPEINIGSMPPLDHRILDYNFTVFPAYAGSNILPLSLEIQEARPEYSTIVPLNLELQRREKTADDLVVIGQELPTGGGGLALPVLNIDVETDIPKTSRINRDAYAVVIGNKNYQNTYPVEYADRDALFMERYFVSAFGIPEENIHRLDDATKGNFESAFGPAGRHKLGWLYKNIIPEKSDVYIYYSGHGCPDLQSTEAYFVPFDASLQNIQVTGYRLQTLFDNLAKIPARNYTVIIDACFSGQTAKGFLVEGVSPIQFKVKSPEYLLGERGVVFTSSGPNEVSNWYADMKHGLFTYYFMKGLLGYADADGDNKITVGEMAGFLTDDYEGVNRKARQMGMMEQNPQIIGDDESILFRL